MLDVAICDIKTVGEWRIMSSRRRPTNAAERVVIRINRVPHPHPDEAEDLIAKLVVRELVSRRGTAEGML